MTDLNIANQSELRLFLSVDIAGSTALKNKKNHTGLLEEYEDRKASLRTFIDKGIINGAAIDFEDIGQSVQGILHDYSAGDFDWAAILEQRFQDFHIEFAKELLKNKLENLAELDLSLWKAMGDELIYSFKISDRQRLHYIVVSFLKVIKDFDQKDVLKKLIRLKGSGWVAGFPVRNRMVKFPYPQLYRRNEDDSCNLEYPYPRTDYLGPDMDTGFRIGSCSYPGLMVISVELAELLGEVPGDLAPVRGRVIGWKKLKGVWNETPYPIIWITLPKALEIEYEQFDPWSGAENKFVNDWLKSTPADIATISGVFADCRNKLPATLGLVKPYIVDEITEKAPVPERHGMILHILKSLNDGIAGPQNEKTESPSETGRTKQEAQQGIEQSLPEKD